jgi:hypothetical protein
MGGVVLKGVDPEVIYRRRDFLFGDPSPEEVPEPPPEEPPAPPPEETPEPPPEETPEPPPEETPEPPPEETPEPPPEETPEPPPEETPEPPPEETPEPPPEETPEPPPEETPEPPPEETPEPPPEETPEPPPEETPEPPPEETPEPPPEDTGDEGAPPVNPILGTQGSDRLPGTDGMDLLYGLSGDDTMDGDAGRDLIDGGAGRDDLTGGEGGDWFVFADFDLGFDVVRDFVPGTDQIVLDHEDMQSIDDLGVFRFFYEDTPSAIVGFIGENGMMDRSMGGIILKGIRPGDLTEADFIFEDALPPELLDEAASDDLDGADVIAALFIRYEDRDALMDAASGIDDDGMAEASRRRKSFRRSRRAFHGRLRVVHRAAMSEKSTPGLSAWPGRLSLASHGVEFAPFQCTGPKISRAGRPCPVRRQSGRSSLKVRWPEIIVDTIDWRDMMSSRIAA